MGATWTDIRTREVPDWLTVPAMLIGLAFFIWRLHWGGMELWALGMAVPAIPTIIPWLLGGYGGGDFKLSLAFGALGGPMFGGWALAAGLVAGIPLFIGWAVWRRLGHSGLPPFAPALGAGAVAALVLLR